MSSQAAKRITLYMPSLAGGGAQRVFLYLAQGFVERGYEVHLVLAKAHGPYLPQVPPSVRMIDLGASRVLTSLPALVRYLRDARPYALLSALDHANAIAVCARAIARVPTRVVVTVHSTPSRVVANARTLRAKMLPTWARFFYRRADAVVAVSQGVASELVHYVGVPPQKVTVIYNPAVTPELFRKADEPLHHPWFCKGEPPVVLGVGRLTEAKDFTTLVRAFALLRQHRPARLMILGEGEDRSQLEQLVEELGLSEDVAMPGFVQNPYPYMKQASVFVLSSKWEGFGLVIGEALALGTPVVSTDCPTGPAEILRGGELGKLVPVGDYRAMAQAIAECLDEGRGAPPDLTHLSIETAVENYLRVLG